MSQELNTKGELKKVGAMWKAEEGKKYKLSGEIESSGKVFPIFLYTNDYKEKDGQPDYNLVISTEPKDKKPQEQLGKLETDNVGLGTTHPKEATVTPDDVQL